MIFDDRNQYTISLRWLVESYSQDQPELSTDEKIAIALPQIFNFNFPIYNEAYRTEFEEKLIRHFYFYEINISSVGAWKFQLRERLNLIMPVYNKMYEAVNFKYDPFIDTSMTETYTRINKLNSNASANTNLTQDVISTNKTTKTGEQQNTGTDVYSDMPQTTLSGQDYATNSNQSNAKTSSTDTQNDNANSNTKNNSSQTSNATSDNTETYEHTNTGFSSKSQQALLMEYYEALRNVDEVIFNELRDLFMLIF